MSDETISDGPGGLVHFQTKPVLLTGFRLSRWNIEEMSEWLAGFDMRLRQIPTCDLFISSFELESAITGRRWGSADFGNWIMKDDSGNFQIVEDRTFRENYDIVETVVSETACDVAVEEDVPAIDEFSGEYCWLSNFYNAPVTYEGVVYLNSEAAFQAQKCPSRASEFANLAPGAAKRLGRKVELRYDWDEVKDSVMRGVVFNKFSTNSELREMLLATGRAELVEGNYWGDRYWGVCKGEGKNMLGKILMGTREKFVEEKLS